jgi:hypothetical protein
MVPRPVAGIQAINRSAEIGWLRRVKQIRLMGLLRRQVRKHDADPQRLELGRRQPHPHEVFQKKARILRFLEAAFIGVIAEVLHPSDFEAEPPTVKAVRAQTLRNPREKLADHWRGFLQCSFVGRQDMLVSHAPSRIDGAGQIGAMQQRMETKARDAVPDPPQALPVGRP